MVIPANLRQVVLTITSNATPGVQNNTAFLAAPGAGFRYRVWAVALESTISGGAVVQPNNPFTASILDSSTTTNVAILFIDAAVRSDYRLLPGGLVISTNQSLNAFYRSTVASQVAIVHAWYSLESA